jgi:hypothetical protein
LRRPRPTGNIWLREYAGDQAFFGSERPKRLNLGKVSRILSAPLAAASMCA